MREKTFTEGKYIFNFEKSMNAYIADKPTYSGLLRVDFIVELEDKYLFIEVKDIEHEKTKSEYKENLLNELKIEKRNPFLMRMSSKFKDTILYNWAKNQYFKKPVFYIIILQFEALNAESRGRLSEKLLSFLPTCLKNEDFLNNVKIKKCKIINIDEWNNDYKDFPINIVSEGII